MGNTTCANLGVPVHGDNFIVANHSESNVTNIYLTIDTPPDERILKQSDLLKRLIVAIRFVLLFMRCSLVESSRCPL